jgi:hypothetical protein
MRKLVDASPNDTSVRHVRTAAGHGFPGSTPAEQKEIYRTAGVQLASSRFCLVPAGDNEVSSRLYSAGASVGACKCSPRRYPFPPGELEIVLRRSLRRCMQVLTTALSLPHR